MHYYNARYYDAHIRRFTQPDDVVQDVYDPQSLNRYAYVRNNPLKYTDPSGNNFISDIYNKAKNFVGGVVNTVKDAFSGVASGVGSAVSAVLGVFTGSKSSTNPQTKQSNQTNISGSNNSQPGGNNSSDSPPTILTLKQDAKIAQVMSYTPFEVRVLWFGYMETYGGPWDYRGRYGDAYERFGNFHYGYVGSAAGFSTSFLLGSAGVAQQARKVYDQFKGNPPIRTDGIPFLSGQNGDAVHPDGSSHDQIDIKTGADTYHYSPW